MFDESNQGKPSISEKYLRPAQAAKYLTEYLGLQTAVRTLAKLRCVGGGPKFRRFGRLIVYSPHDLSDWAKARLSIAFESTSAADQLETSIT